MASLVTLVMLLAFLMGLGYTPPDRLSKKDAADPWNVTLNKSAKISHDKWGADPWNQSLSKSAQISQKRCNADPWSELNKSGASQKEYHEVEWWDDCW